MWLIFPIPSRINIAKERAFLLTLFGLVTRSYPHELLLNRQSLIYPIHTVLYLWIMRCRKRTNINILKSPVVISPLPASGYKTPSVMGPTTWKQKKIQHMLTFNNDNNFISYLNTNHRARVGFTWTIFLAPFTSILVISNNIIKWCRKHNFNDSLNIPFIKKNRFITPVNTSQKRIRKAISL